jgi:hypothetical protein
MKSTPQQLADRGYLEKGTETSYFHFSLPDKLLLLQSNTATERTLGARLLKNERNEGNEIIEKLIEVLRKEKKLYPKIEICNTLAGYDEQAVKPLIAELRKIGSNQHNMVPEKKFGKDNYPLLRDIAARTLAQIGVAALPFLLEALQQTSDTAQLSEIIDTIGCICFYHPQQEALLPLQTCFIQHQASELIRWKTYRAMSAFAASVPFLKEQLKQETSPALRNEIERSLRLLLH